MLTCNSGFSDCDGALGSGCEAGTDPVAVTVGNYHACAALRTGGVLCVGYDTFGQLGDGPPFTASSTPVAALGLP